MWQDKNKWQKYVAGEMCNTLINKDIILHVYLSE